LSEHAGVTIAGLIGSVLLISGPNLFGQEPEALIARGRQTIGGTGRLKNIRALILSGRSVRVGAGSSSSTTTSSASIPKGASLTPVMKPADVRAQLTISILLPDRFRWEESIETPSGTPVFVRVSCLDGEELWLDTHPAGPLPSGTTVNIVPPKPPDSAARIAANSRMARYLLALLLDTNSKLPIALTYAGRATAPDGEADVLDAKGPDGFEARLFLNRETGLPLMLSYPPDNRAGPAGGAIREELRLSEYRRVDGLLLPHQLTISSGNKITQEIHFERYRLDPKLGPRDFHK
jgi:hypothetical protein